MRIQSAAAFKKRRTNGINFGAEKGRAINKHISRADSLLLRAKVAKFWGERKIFRSASFYSVPRLSGNEVGGGGVPRIYTIAGARAATY